MDAFRSLAVCSLLLAATPTAAAAPESPSKCLSAVLTKDHFLLAGRDGAIGGAHTYDELRAELAELTGDFIDERQLLVLAEPTVPDAWIQDLEVLLLSTHFTHVAVVEDKALKAALANGKLPLEDLMRQCEQFEAAHGFKPVAPHLTPLAVPASLSPPPAEEEAMQALLLCEEARRASIKRGFQYLASGCGSLPGCAQGCRAELSVWAAQSVIAQLRTCRDFRAAEQTCAPVSAEACGRRWVLGRLAEFVKSTAVLGEVSTRLAAACQPLLSPDSPDSPVSAARRPATKAGKKRK